jgi:MFS transporter, DHA1 family, multidrug resistance protein
VTSEPTLGPEPIAQHSMRPGSKLFTLVLAMSMAVTALGVDTVLPAFPEIRETLGLAEGATEVAGLITFFLMGSSLGLLPAGLLADRFGRLPVMWGGLVLYVVGAVGALLAPSLTMMYVARFVWGLGTSGPRVAAMAMVRDSYAGAQMAKQMSYIMAVFILVPTFAPTLAAGLLLIGPWQLVFWLCIAAGVGMLVATLRLPETLPVSERSTLSGRDIWHSCATVITTPGTLGYLTALTALFGVFLSYIASSEVIFDQVFGLGDWFPLLFGGLSIAMGLGMFVSGRIVEQVGLNRLALATDGRPSIWPFLAVMSAVLFTAQMLIPNLNAAAMQPLAHVAGTGSAILGMVPGVVGSLIGTTIDRQFDGTVLPLSIAFAVGTVVAFGAWRWAIVATRQTL